jgi:hypothetical protein
MIHRSGFQAPNRGLHPGYEGRNPYTGRGGGRYGDYPGRGRSSGHHGGGRQARGRSYGRGGRGGFGGRYMMHESGLDQQQNVSANGANQTERGGAAGETIAISLNLPAQAVTLLQQAFAAAQEATTKPAKPAMTDTNTTETVDPKGKNSRFILSQLRTYLSLLHMRNQSPLVKL